MENTLISRGRCVIARKTAQRGLIGAAAVLLSGAPAHAQQNEMDALRAQIADLTSRLLKLEEAGSTSAAAAKSAPPATSKFPVVVSGLLQVHGRGFFDQDDTFNPGGIAPTTVRQPNTFALRRGEIRLAGTITPRVSGLIMIDPAKAAAVTSSSTFDAATGKVTTSTNINQSSNILQEIQLSYLLSKRAKGSHYVDVGQFKIPVGFEGDKVSSREIPTVERALMFTNRDPFGGGYGDIREAGARLRGSISQFDYELGIFNGLGERQNTTATSDTKAYLGRVSYKPASVQGLQVGVSGGKGNTRNTAFGTPIPASPSAFAVRADRDLLNLFADYKKDKWSARAEYLTGDAQFLPEPTSPSTIGQRDISSYYGLVGYSFTPKIEGILRYDSFEFDRNISDTTVRDITLGVNYYIKGHNAKIQANLIKRNGAGGINSAAPPLGSGFSLGQVQQFQRDHILLRTNFQVAF